jgi:hypothetical protein
MRLQFVTDYPDIGDGLLYIHYPSSSSDRRDVSIELYEVSSADADGLLYAHRVSNAGGDDSQEVITFRYRNENVHLYPPMDGVLLATVGKPTTAKKAGLPSSMFFIHGGRITHAEAKMAYSDGVAPIRDGKNILFSADAWRMIADYFLHTVGDVYGGRQFLHSWVRSNAAVAVTDVLTCPEDADSALREFLSDPYITDAISLHIEREKDADESRWRLLTLDRGLIEKQTCVKLFDDAYDDYGLLTAELSGDDVKKRSVVRYLTIWFEAFLSLAKVVDDDVAEATVLPAVSRVRGIVATLVASPTYCK